jgi:hypothetical protein
LHSKADTEYQPGLSRNAEFADVEQLLVEASMVILVETTHAIAVAGYLTQKVSSNIILE